VKYLVQTIPFLRITLAFAMGIFIACKFTISVYYVGGFIFLLLIALLLIQRNYSYRLETVAGWMITALFISFGMVFSIRSNQKPHFFAGGKFAGIVLETPEEKENSFKTILKLNYFFRNDSIFKTEEKILAYLEKNDRIKELEPGDVILFNSEPRLVRNNGNPYEFDYQNYLSLKKIYRQSYLRNSDWIQTKQHVNSISVFAEMAREKLLKIYRKQNLGDEETEILSALTLGYKRGLDPETKRVFSSAGAMHVLAVSGLHVGILYAVFILFFGFLRKNKSGKFIFVFGSLVVLWSYVFITGLSPSVMRAATMFSLVCIGTNIQRRPNIYNSLAFAAFLLLLINPNNLFEVGFQLSFAAVFGIVFLQPRLARLWPLENVILKFVWALLTVSVAAQLATFPFTSYYFSQFPTYFWLSNLVVIPAAFLTIGLGIGLLIFSQVPILSSAFSFLTKWVIHITFLFLKAIESLPASVIEIGITPIQALLIGSILISIFIFLRNQNIRTIKIFLLLTLIFFAFTFIGKFKQLTSNEFIAYNNPDNPVIHLIVGQKNYVISEFPVNHNDFIFRAISSVKTKKHLDDPCFLNISGIFENETLFIKNRTIFFKGKVFVFDDPHANSPDNIPIDYLISRNSQLSTFIDEQQNPTIIDFSKYTTKTNSNAHLVANNGAFHEIWHRSPIQTNDH